MCEFVLGNNLISPNQSGFKPGDSCINQSLSISEIYSPFDKGFEVREALLDVSKAFDKVLALDGLIYKLKCNDISGDLLNVFNRFAT